MSNSIEARRLSDTEFPAHPAIAEHYVVPWWGDRSEHFPTGPGVGADRPWRGAVDIAADLLAARRLLDAEQAEQLSQVSADAAAAVGRVARRLRPGLSEYEVAGQLSAELLATELEPVVLMVAADGRDRRHRHPLPTGQRATAALLLVCCARRHGLIASVTRHVLFTDAGLDPAERDERYRALLEVERAYLDQSRPGTRLGAVLDAGISAYRAHGFEAEE